MYNFWWWLWALGNTAILQNISLLEIQIRGYYLQDPTKPPCMDSCSLDLVMCFSALADLKYIYIFSILNNIFIIFGN